MLSLPEESVRNLQISNQMVYDNRHGLQIGKSPRIMRRLTESRDLPMQCDTRRQKEICMHTRPFRGVQHVEPHGKSRPHQTSESRRTSIRTPRMKKRTECMGESDFTFTLIYDDDRRRIYLGAHANQADCTSRVWEVVTECLSTAKAQSRMNPQHFAMGRGSGRRAKFFYNVEWQHKVTIVRLDREGISDTGASVQCMELNAVYHERGSQIQLPSTSARLFEKRIHNFSESRSGGD
jgi:hypothetical protein